MEDEEEEEGECWVSVWQEKTKWLAGNFGGRSAERTRSKLTHFRQCGLGDMTFQWKQLKKLASTFPEGSGRIDCAVKLHKISFIRSGHSPGTENSSKRLRAWGGQRREEEMNHYQKSLIIVCNPPRHTVSSALTEDEAGGINTVTNGGRGQKSSQSGGTEPDAESSPSLFVLFNKPEGPKH